MNDLKAQTCVGVLGGGQLARMMALAGLPMGVKFRVFDPSSEACAGQVAPLTVGDFSDHAALLSFADEVDALTFDFENVPAASVQALCAQLPVRPGALALATAQDRWVEKSRFNALGIPTPKFMAVDSRESLITAVTELGAPCVLKTRRFGYDGKGQYRIKSDTDIVQAWEALGAQAATVGLILEAFVSFERELSVIAVRSSTGEFAAWPLTQNWHVDGVLSASVAPATVDSALEALAIAHAKTLAEDLDYVGVFALELFDCGDQLLANEMAPRVHNSGHWTIEGAETSQFENHVRAVLGLPLGSTAARGASCMLNFLGDMPDAAPLLAVEGAHWHDYGKSARAGRKVGHATLRADSFVGLLDHLKSAGVALQREAQVAPVIEWLAKHC